MDANPIRLYLAVDRTPAGEAPLEIRQQWIGTFLPMRYERPIERPHPMAGAGLETHAVTSYEDAAYITTSDAIAALDRAGRAGAAAYWEHMFNTGRAPGLIFEVAAGRLLPPDLASRLHPGLLEP